jgi:hypothetical protein
MLDNALGLYRKGDWCHSEQQMQQCEKKSRFQNFQTKGERQLKRGVCYESEYGTPFIINSEKHEQKARGNLSKVLPSVA